MYPSWRTRSSPCVFLCFSLSFNLLLVSVLLFRTNPTWELSVVSAGAACGLCRLPISQQPQPPPQIGIADNQAAALDNTTLWPLCYIAEPAGVTPSARADSANWPHKVKVMAYVFPQFHELPLNDRLWGKGFTEWTMLDRIMRNKYGDIIRKPSETGNYNLLSRFVRKRYADLSREFGIYGFVFHHYYFASEGPVMDRWAKYMLRDGHPNTNYFFSWANEAWTRNWDGGDREVLVGQDYGNQTVWREHFDYLVPYFQHANYLHINGCAAFAIYKPWHEDLLRMIPRWRQWARETAGVGCLHLIGSLFGVPQNATLGDYFDATAEFQPHAMPTLSNGRPSFHYRGLLAGWDASPRHIRDNNAPVVRENHTSYEHTQGNTWKAVLVEEIRNPNPLNNSFVFINAWNEWGEGNVLEPNSVYGRGLLQAMKKALTEADDETSDLQQR